MEGKEPNGEVEKDTTPKVTGIGGIFFFSEDAVKFGNGMLKIWGLL